MEFQTKIILLSFAITIVLAFIIIPILKKLKIGQIERVEGPQSHLKKQGTPTMGGIIMIIVIILVGGWTMFNIANQKVVNQDYSLSKFTKSPTFFPKSVVLSFV